MALTLSDSSTTNLFPEVLEQRTGEVSEDSIPHLDLEFWKLLLLLCDFYTA